MAKYSDDRRFRSSAISYMDDRPYPNSEMVIFKFDWMRTQAMDWQSRTQLRRRIYKDCELMGHFKIAFINQFASLTWDQCCVHTRWQRTLHKQDPVKFPDEYIPYEKEWLLDQYEIGMDLLHKEYGVRNEHHWRSWYILVPKVEVKMVQWMLDNKPYFVKVMKRI